MNDTRREKLNIIKWHLGQIRPFFKAVETEELGALENMPRNLVSIRRVESIEFSANKLDNATRDLDECIGEIELAIKGSY